MSKEKELILRMKEMSGYVLRYKWLVLLWLLLVTAAGGFIGEKLTPKVYYSSAQIYVRPYNAQGEIYSEDLLVSQKLTTDFMEIIQSRPVLEGAIAGLGLQDIMSYESLLEQMFVTAEYQSRLIEMIVADTDRDRAQEMAGAICEKALKQTENLAGVQWAAVSDEPSYPRRAAYPVLWETALQSLSLGVAGLFLYLVILTSGERRIREKSDVDSYLKLSVLGTIPDRKKMKQK